MPRHASPVARLATPSPDVVPPKAGAFGATAAACACGGGCPRCARIGTPGDEAEREAERAADAGRRSPGDAEHLERARSRARFHTGPAAARLARALDARAYTVGRDVVFGDGEYRPDTPEGQHLITHELAHVAQQERKPEPVVRRQQAGQSSGVVQMPPLTVTSTLSDTGSSVSGLANLRGVGTTALQVGYPAATVVANSPNPMAVLPFVSGGWDAQAILTSLGQYDTLAGTDSDAIRCVQAVAMASRIVDGPRAVIGFLRAMILEGMLSRPMNPRQRTAIAVLQHVIARIEAARATYGDMAWAQEALHDLFYNDVSGTPEPEMLDRLAPAMEFGRTLTRLSVWCNTPQEVMTQANALQPGEHLLVSTWQVMFDTAFDDLDARGIQVPQGQSIGVSVNGQQRVITRIPTNVRPPHTAIDDVRDHRGGHQLIIMKDGATGTLRLYDPEVTPSGRHLDALATNGSNFLTYFGDQPQFGIYNYMEIIGKLSPNLFTTGQLPHVGP